MWWGDTGKAEMPSGRLAFATGRVDLMAASMGPPLTLYGWLTILPSPRGPTKRGKNSARWWSISRSACLYTTCRSLPKELIDERPG